MNNFWKRTATAVIFVIVLLAAIWHPVSCALLFGVIALLSVNEFYNITRHDTDSHVNKIGGMTLATIPFLVYFIPLSVCSFFSIENSSGVFRGYTIPFLFLCTMAIQAIASIFIFIAELFRNKGNSLRNLSYLFFGQIFFIYPWIIATVLPYYETTPSLLTIFKSEILYALFFTIWLNDTGAYLCGCTLGKHKFFERISPKKTWEGFAGGALLAILVGAFVFPHLFGKGQIFWLLFTLIAVVFGTLGDLIESLIKRSVGVKDSGNILPGHGGILDRFDSFMFAAPAIFIYISIYNIM